LRLAKGEKIFTEKLIFRDLENLAKEYFLRKNILELLYARVLHIFDISAKFPFF
jgi:hypothetical protein